MITAYMQTELLVSILNANYVLTKRTENIGERKNGEK